MGVARSANGLFHAGGLVSLAVLSGSWLAVLYRVADVTRGTAEFVPLVALAVLTGAFVGRWISGRSAVAVALALLVGGIGAYLLTVPPTFFDGLTPGRILRDQLSFLGGYSVLGMTNAGVWALAVAPGPAFLSAYFAARTEYVRAATVGGATLFFFVLSGDSTALTTMTGTLGAVGALGFHGLVVRGAKPEQTGTVAVAVAGMVLATAVLGVAPPVASIPVDAGFGGGGGPETLEASLVSADDRTRIGGSIELSPEVRFTVTADEGRYWRVGAYDRYTGDGWIRTGGETVFTSGATPPGERDLVRQEFTAATDLGVLPAAAEPVSVSGTDAVLTSLGTLGVDGTVRTGERYTVVSEVQDTPTRVLAGASGDYPDWVRERYLGLPGSTPSRVGERTASVVGDAGTPYRKAAAIESHLESTKEYSLDVERPGGSVADAFLFEMDAGYCVYFATTMVAMLRSEGVPARYTVGYTTGQQTDGEEWTVRGLDSHAWVEAYVPGYGWVEFDPTPGTERRAAERDALEDARANNASNVDTDDTVRQEYPTTTTTTTSQEPSPRPTFTSDNRTETSTTPDTPTSERTTVKRTTTDREGSTGFAVDGPILPPPSVLAVWGVVCAGLAVAARRSGLTARAYRAAWLRRRPKGGPESVVTGAYERVEYLLARRERPRRRTETVREYLDAVDADDAARRVARLRERALYGDAPGKEEAAEAWRLLGSLRDDDGDNV